MKIFALIAAAVILSSPAKARDFSATEKFITYTVLAPVVAKCPSRVMIEGGAYKYAIANGLNFEVLGDAAGNAVLATIHKPYDKTKLIPFVTKYVELTIDFVGHELTRLELSGFCERYGKILVGAGIMK